MKIKEGALVEILWKDATVKSGWFFDREEEDLEPMNITTVGWIAKDTKKFVTLTQSICPVAVGNLTCIPKGWIIKMRKLT